MNANQIAKGILKAVAIILGVFLLFYMLYNIQSVIAYILVAVVVSLIGRPLVLLLRDKLRFPNILSVAVTMLFLLGLLVGLIGLFIPLITDQGENLALLNIKSMEAELQKSFSEVAHSFGPTQEILEEIVEEVDIEQTVKEELNIGFVPKLLNSVLEIISATSIALFSILFISFFLLKDTKKIQAAFLDLFPTDKNLRIVNSIDTIKSLLSRYFIGLLLQILILFTIYAITLTIVGIEHPLVIAFLCALFNIIPYVGPIIGALFLMVFTITSNIGMDFTYEILPKMGYVSIGIIFGQLVDNFFSQPFIFSNSVKSHPLEIFLIIIIAGLLFGVVGMIVAVPGYTVLKVFLREFYPEIPIVKALTKQL